MSYAMLKSTVIGAVCLLAGVAMSWGLVSARRTPLPAREDVPTCGARLDLKRLLDRLEQFETRLSRKLTARRHVAPASDLPTTASGRPASSGAARPPAVTGLRRDDLSPAPPP